MPRQTGGARAQEGEESMIDEKRLIGEVKRDGTLLYELAEMDFPHGVRAEANRWEAGVSSCMGACSMAEREQIAERLRVAVNAYEPMRALLQKCATVLARSLVEWCAGCGRKRTTPGPCPHCSADGRHVATAADAPERLHLLAAELRAAGVEPTP